MTYPDPRWNDTATPYQRQATLPELIRTAAARAPDAPAIGDSAGTSLTHGQLDRWSDRLANLLTEIGIGRGAYVALLSDRDAWAVAALVAIMKTGAAYVPVDPRWPRARVESLLGDLDVACIIAGTAQQREAQRLAATLSSVRGVICPGRPDRYECATALDAEAVTDVFDYIAGQDDPLLAAGFNARGGNEYGYQDLAAYREHVARLVLAGGPARPDVLEIGCGSGEIAGELLGAARRYAAVDISPVSVQRVRDRYGAGHPGLTCAVGPAHQVADLVTGPFDVVLLSSTTQFFPDAEYLYRTIESALSLVRPGGRVLLCDLIDPAAEQHPGLSLPPGAFTGIGAVLPAITEVTVHHRHDSDLAGALRFRYDVELTVGAPERAQRVPAFWTGADIAERPARPPEVTVAPDDVAYAIFTSGSTGRPKAVAVSHRPVVNLIEWLQREYGVGAADRLLFVTSFCFDLSVFDMFGVLASGGYLRVADASELSEPDVLIDLLLSERITIWDSAPAVLGMVALFLGMRDDLAGAALRLVLLSGDWIPLTLPGEMRSAFPGADIVAMGGATECTVWSNHHLANVVDPTWPSIPYGKPIANARYYVLDESGAQCRVGVAGDLYIGGECLALGYLNAPELTASKFVRDPFSATPGARMYRTGDRARWWEPGILEFLGRLDDQVKINGYRIELGEVQAALAQVPGVRAAVVVTVPGPGASRLAGFYLSDGPGADLVDPERVRGFLGGLLPGYMVPELLFELDEFPLAAMGKVDRAALVAHASREEARWPAPVPG
jgi:amino acid adenylation domain-containing protein